MITKKNIQLVFFQILLSVHHSLSFLPYPHSNLSFVDIYTIKPSEYMMKDEDIQFYMDFQLFNHYCSSVKLLYCHQLEPFHNSLSHYRTYPKMHLFLQMILYHNNKNTLFVPNPKEHFFLGHPV